MVCGGREMQKQRGQLGPGGCAGNGLSSAEWELEARAGGGEEAGSSTGVREPCQLLQDKGTLVYLSQNLL